MGYWRGWATSMSSVTGEPLPVSKSAGEEVFSGTISGG